MPGWPVLVVRLVPVAAMPVRVSTVPAVMAPMVVPVVTALTAVPATPGWPIAVRTAPMAVTVVPVGWPAPGRRRVWTARVMPGRALTGPAVTAVVAVRAASVVRVRRV